MPRLVFFGMALEGVITVGGSGLFCCGRVTPFEL